jgi:chemotaxis response regulator CheB
MKVEPNRIYLIPPNKNMEIENDTLFLEEARPLRNSDTIGERE